MVCVADGIAEPFRQRVVTRAEACWPPVTPKCAGVVGGNLPLAINLKLLAFCPRGEISIGQFPWPPVSTARSYRLFNEFLCSVDRCEDIVSMCAVVKPYPPPLDVLLAQLAG